MNIYETVTEKLITAMEQGRIPWRQTWKSNARGARIPSNQTTGRMYRGINVWLLACAPYESKAWMTFNQAKDLGCYVRKGEKGWPVVFWKFDPRPDPVTGKDEKFCFMRSYTVFNVEQIDGLPNELPFEEPAFDSIAAADSAISEYFNRDGAPTLHHGGGSAYYMPGKHEVVMPVPSSFVQPEAYYSTLFHEMGHSTGPQLKRNMSGHTGGRDYSKEELIAEFTAAFLCAECGVTNEFTERNTTAYLQSWISALRNDKTMAVSAAQKAQRAADFIRGRVTIENEGAI